MRGKKVYTRAGKRASLGNNPLFVALQVGEGVKTRNDTFGRSQGKRVRRETVANELLQRLERASGGGGQVSPLSFSKKGLEKRGRAVPKGNALAAALGMGSRGGDERKSGGRGEVPAVQREKPVRRTLMAAAVGARKGDRAAAVMTGKKAQDITFRNASLIPFLRIENLTDDASEADITMVLTERLGPVLKVLKMRSTYKKTPAVTVEVFFLHEDELQNYVASLNEVTADGRVLKVSIAYHSQIINSDRLWDSVLKEVRTLRQLALQQGTAARTT